MRTTILGSVGALLAAAPLCLAGDPPAPAFIPPSAFTADVPPATPPAAVLPNQLPSAVIPKPADAPPPPAGPAQPQQQSAPASTGCSTAAEPIVKFQDTHVGPCEQIWLDAGYRVWWIKDARVNGPLVTPSTSTLFSGGEVAYGSFNGFNVDGGMWLDCRHTFGIEAGGFYFGRQDVTATAASDATGRPQITRPFTNAVTITPANLFVSLPDVLAGAVTVKTTSQFGGVNINGVKNLANCENYTIDTLIGFRYIDLEERLNVTQTSTPLNGGTLTIANNQLPVGVGLRLSDDFHTRNQFYGGLIGSRGELRFGPVFIDLTSSVALGPNHQVLETFGQTAATNGAATVGGGFLAVGGGNAAIPGSASPTSAFVPTFIQQGNIGRFTTNRFIFVPEVGLQAGAYVTSHIKLSVGYNFLYMTDVVRPGTQVDTQINTRFVPASPAFGSTSGQSVPMVTGTREDFHAQGVTFSAEIKY